MLAMKHFYIIPEYMNHHVGLIYKKEKCKAMAFKIRSNCICCLKTTVCQHYYLRYPKVVPHVCMEKSYISIQPYFV